MEELPSITDLLRAAPTITITVMLVALGWWARGSTAQKHIDTMKEFIEYLKNKGGHE